MGKLSSEWRKNNTDISLSPIYLPKLHENILKNYGVNLFKEISIDSNYGLLTNSETPASFSDGLSLD